LDYSKAYAHIFTPEGSLWKAPNCIWITEFARNKPAEEFHPALVQNIRRDYYTLQLAPGTSKSYRQGSCVFKVRLRTNFITSYFLLMLSMPYVIDDLLKLRRGWKNINELNYQQKKDLIWQIKMCKG